MKKKTTIVFSCVLAAAVSVTVAVLVWAFPRQDKWRKELKNGFSAPAEGERYVCDMTYTAKKKGGDETVRTSKSIGNEKSDGVWQYVGNSDSGGYRLGDICYRYDGDPLSGGKLTEAGADVAMPRPEYAEYFSFLFGEEGSPDFSVAARSIGKSVWGGVCAYSFTLKSEWFIENEAAGFHMTDDSNYRYGDVRFTVKKNAADGKVLQISCSYDYDVKGHSSVVMPPYPEFQNPEVIYVKPYGYKINIKVQFSYPREDTGIETDAQFDLSRALDSGRADKTLATLAGEYLSSEPSSDPSFRYAVFAGVPSADRPALRTYPTEDVFVLYDQNRLEAYRAGTLEKIGAADFLLNVAAVDVADGRLLVTLRGDTVCADGLEDLPWEGNYCFIVYDLSDFSVIHRHKAEGRKSDYPPSGGVYTYLYGDRIVYVGGDSRISLYDMTAGNTQITEYSAFCQEQYLDRENRRLLYRDESMRPKSYDLATGQVADRTQESVPSTPLVVGNFELSCSGDDVVFCERESGATVCTVAYRCQADTDGDFAVRLTDGRDFCSVGGCILIIDITAL